jgi:hypothetical protein
MLCGLSKHFGRFDRSGSANLDLSREPSAPGTLDGRYRDIVCLNDTRNSFRWDIDAYLRKIGLWLSLGVVVVVYDGRGEEKRQVDRRGTQAHFTNRSSYHICNFMKAPDTIIDAHHMVLFHQSESKSLIIIKSVPDI